MLDGEERDNYPPGCLVIFTSKQCGWCNALEEQGLFDKLEDRLDLGRGGVVMRLKANSKGLSSEAKIFNIEAAFPSFRYMTRNTFDRAIKSGDNYEPFINEICYYNRQYNYVTKQVETTKEHPGIPTFESIQIFCDESAIELDKRRNKAILPVKSGFKMLYGKK